MAITQKQFLLIGTLAWVANIQYFIVQIIVALHWSQPYSIRTNAISDLGNTVCGDYSGRMVCSPLHTWMNASFIVLGCTVLIGTYCLFRTHSSNKNTLGFSFLILSGLGTILVGLFPENTIIALHVLGAGLSFVFGNSGLLLLATTFSPTLKRYSQASGLIGLVALILFIAHHYLGLGLGGMERLTAYPQTIWMIVVGGFLLVSFAQNDGNKKLPGEDRA